MSFLLKGFTKLDNAEDMAYILSLKPSLAQPALLLMAHRNLKTPVVSLETIMGVLGLGRSRVYEIMAELKCAMRVENGWVFCPENRTDLGDSSPENRTKNPEKWTRKSGKVDKTVRKSGQSQVKNPVQDEPKDTPKEVERSKEKEAEAKDIHTQSLSDLQKNEPPPIPTPPPQDRQNRLAFAERIAKLQESESGRLISLAMPGQLQRKERLQVLESLVLLYPTEIIREALEKTKARLPEILNPAIYLQSVAERLFAEKPTPPPPPPAAQEWRPGEDRILVAGKPALVVGVSGSYLEVESGEWVLKQQARRVAEHAA